jgi:Domain of unknown function (DUF4166)
MPTQKIKVIRPAEKPNDDGSIPPVASDGTPTAVTAWFGPRFPALHPLLQALHRRGGRLSGTIGIECGRGLAGWVGRRLARRLGIPTDRTERGFAVEIRHGDGVLEWHRQFDDGSRVTSLFRPIGTWPEGCWSETTGPLRLTLTVDVIEGGWHWRPLSATLGRLPLPIALFPRAEAYKRIEAGRYRFVVAFTVPGLGMVLRYGGLLDAEATAPQSASSPGKDLGSGAL